MSEAQQDTGATAAPSLAGLGSPTPGMLLAAGRQKLGWSVGDVAAKLRMSVVQVDALEQGDYTRLPTGTFLRGFVRSYAKLVSLDPAEVLASLEETHAEGRRPSIVVPTQNIALSKSDERFATARAKGLLIVALLVALAGGGSYWWLHIRPDQSRQPEAARSDTRVVPLTLPVQPAQPAPAETAAADPALPAATGANTAPAASPAAGSAATAASATPLPAAAAPAASAPAPEPQPAALTQTTAPLAAPAGQDKPVAVPKGSGSLQFSFTGECWVEVTEASGKTLLSRRFAAGESERIVGKLPLAVAIGNAPVTRLKYNEVEFDLAPHTRVSVARFTLK